MKMIGGRPIKTMTSVYKCLLVCLAVLVLILIVGTVYGFLSDPEPSTHERIGDSQEGGALSENKEQAFTGIGQIRVPTAGPQPEMVILSISFVYDPRDRAFSEELALRVGKFKSTIESYIGSFSAAEFRKLDDDTIKAELLRRFNSILRLGQIETLYLSDFMVIE